MKGGLGESDESGVGKVMDQFLLMLHVLPVLLITWLMSNLGFNSWLLYGLFFGYLFWVRFFSFFSLQNRCFQDNFKDINICQKS